MTRPCSGARRVGGDLAPAAWRRAEIDHSRTFFEKSRLVVDLHQLVSGTRAHAFALGARDVRIVELTLQPLAGGLRSVRLFDANFFRTLALCHAPSGRRLVATVPCTVFAHHLHQHALAQAAVGDAKTRTRKRTPDRLEDRTAGEHKVCALGADARARHPSSCVIASSRSMTAVIWSASIQQPSTRLRS